MKLTIENYDKIVGMIHYFNAGCGRLEVTEVVRNNIFNSYLFLCSVADNTKLGSRRNFTIQLHWESLNLIALDMKAMRESSVTQLSLSDIKDPSRFVEFFGPKIKEIL